MFKPNSSLSMAAKVEQINDTAHGNYVEVIVQLKKSKKNTAFSSAAADLLGRRATALSPRDMLDPRSIKSRISRSTRKSSSRATMIRGLKNMATSGASPLTKSDIAQKAFSRMEDIYKKRTPKKKQKKYRPAHFWSSQSMLMQVTKQELAALPETVANIQDISINRSLSVPVIRETSEPLSIEKEDLFSTTWGLQRANALSAWGVYGAEGQGVTIGVLDTGIDASHPDLQGKVAHWAELDSMGNIIDTTNPRDSGRHGTHVAGTIAGGDASGRWIGMAPQAKIAAALVLDGDNGGTDAQVLAGIDWAVESGVDAINMSLGGIVLGAETPPTYADAIISSIIAGIPVICAIGNEGAQTSGLPGSDLFALSVGATDSGDRTAGFSGGRTQFIFESDVLNPDTLPQIYIKPDLSAPGVSVYSSIPGADWSSFSGTSMATPHVAGAVALLLSATSIRDSLSGADLAFGIQELMLGSLDDLGESGQDARYGFGRLDILRCIDMALQQGLG